IAVDDAAVVRDGHGSCQGFDQQRGCARARRTLAHPLVEAAAFDKLQREERTAFVLARFVNLDDIRMRELRDRFGFGSKTGEADRADVCAGEDHLKSNQALQPTMPGLVNNPHATAPEFREDVISWYTYIFERRQIQTEVVFRVSLSERDFEVRRADMAQIG